MKITLRSFLNSDCRQLAAYANNKNIAANLRDSFPYPYTDENAAQYIAKQLDKLIQTDFAITLDGNFAGRIALDQKTDIYSKSAEIGYWLAEPFWGKGIATMAIIKMCEYAKQHFDVVRLVAICYESNIGSRKALVKSGFALESIRIKAVFKYGQILNDCVYVKII